MPEWTKAYRSDLKGQFDKLTGSLASRLAQITDGQSAPALESVVIGSARELSACVLFFDIEGSSLRTPSGSSLDLRRTLVTLNCVIPMMSRVVTDHAGYIEKNTGDGLMAIIGAGDAQEKAVSSALDAAVTCFFVLREFINPFLSANGIPPVDARIGIDYGRILVARIGLPTGSSGQDRNFLTAIGPAANIANRLQGLAGTNGICVGHTVWAGATPLRRAKFLAYVPTEWHWVFQGTQDRYWVWRFTEIRTEPFDLSSVFADLIRPKRG